MGKVVHFRESLLSRARNPTQRGPVRTSKIPSCRPRNTILYISRELLRLGTPESEALLQKWVAIRSSIRYRIASAIGDLLPRYVAEPLIEPMSDEPNPFMVCQWLHKLRLLLIQKNRLSWTEEERNRIKLAVDALNESRKHISDFLTRLSSP